MEINERGELVRKHMEELKTRREEIRERRRLQAELDRQRSQLNTRGKILMGVVISLWAILVVFIAVNRG